MVYVVRLPAGVHGRQTEGQRDLDTDRLILPRDAPGRRRGRIREISSVAAVQNSTLDHRIRRFYFAAAATHAQRAVPGTESGSASLRRTDSSRHDSFAAKRVDF